MNLYLFNPEHDYALADGNPHFVPLQSAAQFAYDCSYFLRFLADEDDFVESLYRNNGNFIEKKYNFDCDFDKIDRVIPWGWNSSLRMQLLKSKIPEQLLPSNSQLYDIRAISHRKTAIDALKFIKINSNYKDYLPNLAVQLTSENEIRSFVKNYEHVLLKSPYSGNGRGHLYAHNECSTTFIRQSLGVISKQGSILAERHLSVIQDFAMLFKIENGNVSFLGFSLFKTNGYAYDHNILISDDKIIQILAKYLDIDLLIEVRELIIRFLEEKISTIYEGNLGVDMFVYREDERNKLQPVSEINFRNTMGIASHNIFCKYFDANSSGFFRVVRARKPGELKKFFEKSVRDNPLVTNNEKWKSGFLSLNPIYDDTKYAVCLNIHENGSI